MARPASVARAGDRRLLTGAASPARIFFQRGLLSGAEEDSARARRKVYLIEATTKLYEPCQVGSGTERPCPHTAAVKIQGVPFCKACARKQEAYFAVGRLVTHAREGRGAYQEQELSSGEGGVGGGLYWRLLVTSRPEGEDLEQ